ncbi:Anaphase-promoting complex subunit cut9 AltName: Full=20S cyclosome/APC complex protein cut9; AltName: Full=Cell untimely torn protein 9 [Serendipita indica DSM 11827]|nr:Anaphase-promoting complex subunit cut9 AltName: Full=20S cyclosome/APC complex protein cut9; AltName: Full=Cell untimely torn protein 9 [Serendipita indica DSM 11827]
MGPAPLVGTLQSLPSTSAQSETNILPPKAPERHTDAGAVPFATPTPVVADASMSFQLDFGKKGRKSNGILGLTPNSSMLLASPLGSSPMARRGQESVGRRGRSRSTRRESLLRNGATSGDTSRPAFRTPSNPKGLYTEEDSLLDTSINHSPDKSASDVYLETVKSEPVGFTSIGSIEESEFTASDEEDEEEWTLVDRMRLWRHDAMTQHLYETAAFWGDKVLTWTNDPSDAFWLAQVHFQTGEYARAERLLTKPFTITQSSESDEDGEEEEEPGEQKLASASFGLGLGLGSQGSQPFVTPYHAQHRHTLRGLQDDPFLASTRPTNFTFKLPMSTAVPRLQLPGRENRSKGDVLPKPNLDSSFTFDGPQSMKQVIDLDTMDDMDHGRKLEEARAERFALTGELEPLHEPGDVSGIQGTQGAKPTRLVDVSVMCRYLAAQCQVRLGKWTEALEVLGEENPFRDTSESGAHVANRDGGLKLEASMCYLRGILYMRLNRSERAKQNFLEALALDIKCFEAYNMLVQCQMLTVDEEWELIQGLKYKEQTPEDADFIRLMYTVRLKKIKHSEEISQARRQLTDEFDLGQNCDILYTLADSLYTQLRFVDAFVVTSRILDISTIHLPTLPIHIACMYHLRHLHSRLFILAHELVDKEPESPMSWYAVGIYYLVISKWREAKQYLSKSTIMDPRHAPGWVAFAHTFAKEGEHEHAITAYSTCARLFKGSHLPHLFIGMEQITLSHLNLAADALKTAQSMCDSDPLVYNEQGVVEYLEGNYLDAVMFFEKALELAKVSQASEQYWLATYCNLGTAHRKLGHFAEAEKAYEKVLTVEPRHANALASLGMVYHMQMDYHQAIQRYHEALSIEPLNANVLELLNMALATGASMPLKLPVLEQKIAELTQSTADKEVEYLRKAVDEEANPTERVSWDKPFGEGSAWMV